MVVFDLDEYFAEVLPQGKADKVKEVQSRGLIVAMTEYRVNDAPALARATYCKMIQNLAWDTGYNAFAIPLTNDLLSYIVFIQMVQFAWTREYDFKLI